MTLNSPNVDSTDDTGAPNVLVNAASNVIAKIRADKDMQEVLEAHEHLHPKAIEKISVEEARRQPTPADAVNALLGKLGKSTDPEVLVPGVKSIDRTITGAAGDIPARIYTPEGTGPFPVIVYFHGGGWVIADKNVYDGGARGLAKQANAVVVSVDYRQAPEHKFPAAWDDALAAYKWALANPCHSTATPRAWRWPVKVPVATWRWPLPLRFEMRACRHHCMCWRSIRWRRPASTPSPTSRTRLPSR